MAYTNIYTDILNLDCDNRIKEALERKLRHDRAVLSKLRKIRAPKNIIACGKRVLADTEERYNAIVKRNEEAVSRLSSRLLGRVN